MIGQPDMDIRCSMLLTVNEMGHALSSPHGVPEIENSFQNYIEVL
uniref:Uncharacterized protein n=1 Tax=Leersia perrieri TaxID=77586 RepID=A0A0D9VVS7_9ORYZ